jgi:Ca2+/Na+ antiporter
MAYFFRTKPKLLAATTVTSLGALAALSVPASLLTQKILNHVPGSFFATSFTGSNFVNVVLSLFCCAAAMLLTAAAIYLARKYKSENNLPSTTNQAHRETVDEEMKKIDRIGESALFGAVFLEAASGKLLYDFIKGIENTSQFVNALSHASSGLLFGSTVFSFILGITLAALALYIMHSNSQNQNRLESPFPPRGNNNEIEMAGLLHQT